MAIARDAQTDGGFATSASSLTYSHSCSGSDRLLVVFVWTTGGDNVTGVTYGGTSMSQIVKVDGSGQYSYLYGIVAPSTGANNVVVSTSASVTIVSCCGSYTGVDQSGVPSITGSGNTASTTSSDTSLTTTENNSWTILGGADGGAESFGAGTGSSVILQMASSLGTLFDSGSAITPASSYTMTITTGSSRRHTRVMCAIEPATATVTFIPKIMMS